MRLGRCAIVLLALAAFAAFRTFLRAADLCLCVAMVLLAKNVRPPDAAKVQRAALRCRSRNAATLARLPHNAALQ